jgi:hypothetical protein
MSRQAETSLMGSEVAAIEPTLSQLNPVVKYLVHIIAARSTVGKEYYTTSRSLTKLLPHCSNFQATDERDQIFGLLGIAVDASDFIPDYNLSVQDVYVDITKHIIKRTKSLAILQMAGIGMTKRRPDLPSWAPDFAFLHHGPSVSSYTQMFLSV